MNSVSFFKKHYDLLVAGFVILFSMITRLIPHVDNFSPMESAVLFGAAYFARKMYAFILPLMTMYMADFVINNTIARSFFPDVEGLVWFSDYMIYNGIAYILIAALGIFWLKKVTGFRVVTGALIASVIFYGITNFGAWADPKSIYPQDLNGLGLSYLAGLPFFRTSLLATIAFSSVFFIMFEKFSSIFIKAEPIAQ